MEELRVKNILSGVLLREGAGVKLRRYIGPEHGNSMDPFLLLDYFNSHDPYDYMAGFPPHPHRGFETITYLLAGEIAHEDNYGHKGVLQAGDVQWMTAGKGIVHSEMPKPDGHLWGFQVWLNLPAKEKMVTPKYQEFNHTQLPKISLKNGATIKIIAGALEGEASPLQNEITEPFFVDIVLPKNQKFTHTIGLDFQTIVLNLSGKITLGTDKQELVENSVAQLTTGDSLIIKGHEDQNHFILMSAKKIREPVARLGPFVMNTREEITQAVEDFKNNRF